MGQGAGEPRMGGPGSMRPEPEVTMGKRMMVAAVTITVVRVVIASASPALDAVLVAVAVLLLVTVWDELGIGQSGRWR
jgi:hypothetical protein